MKEGKQVSNPSTWVSQDLSNPVKPREGFSVISCTLVPCYFPTFHMEGTYTFIEVTSNGNQEEGYMTGSSVRTNQCPLDR